VFAVMVCFGTKVYYRFQSVVWWVGMGCFALLLIVLGFSSHEHFVHGLNAYVQSTSGKSGAYDSIMQTAKAQGAPSGYSLSDTLGMFAVATSVSAAGAYMGGEVRTPLRTQIIGGAGGGLFFGGLVLLVGLLIAKTVGLDFNQAATFLAVQHGDQFLADQTPVFTWYAFLCTSSPVLLVLMCLGVVLLTSILVPQQIMYPTRMLFAWSFDRLIPARVADVSPRTGAPIKATIIVALTCEGLLALYGSGQISYINPILIIGLVWGIIALAAVLFPFMPRSREAFRSSQIGVRVAGIPVISLLGLAGVIFFAISLGVAYTSDTLGANKTSNIIVAAVVFAVALVYFVGVRVVRRNQGINLDATFAELPPD
jgi:basic amino acid/polyamine antiporter, APA family